MNFYGKITEEGKLTLKDKERFEKYLQFQLAGKEIYLEIDRKIDKRTTPMNSLYWLFLDIISQDTGIPSPELHAIFKKMFLPPRFISFKGKEYELEGSTAVLDKIKFQEYLMRISAEVNIPIPDTSEFNTPKSEGKIDYPIRTKEPKF